MTPEQLKASIIYSALQGKLVEQIDEETAVDISKIKEKRTEEIEFDIPEKWKVAHLETVTTSIASKQYQIAASEFKTTGKHPVVSQSKEYVIGYCDDDSKIFHHENPVVIFGDHTTEVKYIDFDFVVGADGVKIFEPIQNILTVKFLKYVLEFYSTGLEKVGGYTRHYKYIKDKPIPLPPIKEQHRIVAKIEEMLPFVDRYAASYEKLEQFKAKFPEDMKKSILQYAIQGKLVEQRPEEGTAENLYKTIQEEKQKLIKEGKIKKEKPLAEITEDEIPFDIPESWKWIRLRDICKKIVDGDHNPPAGHNQPTEYLMLSATNINQDKIVELDKVRYVTQEVFEIENQRTNVEINDIFFTIVGSMGRSCVYKGGMNICFQRSVSVLTTLIYPEFLKYMLDTPYIQDFMYRNATGTAQKGFYLKQVENLVVALPPLAEQHRIVTKIEEMLPYCDQLIHGFEAK